MVSMQSDTNKGGSNKILPINQQLDIAEAERRQMFSFKFRRIWMGTAAAYLELEVEQITMKTNKSEMLRTKPQLVYC